MSRAGAVAILVAVSFQTTAQPFQESEGTAPTHPAQSRDGSGRGSGGLRLGPIPKLAPANRAPLTKEQQAEISACIARLAEIEDPDWGLSATLYGEAFLPLEGQSQASVVFLTDHRLKSSAALRRLVEIGPEALPFLLDALGHTTPTKLTFKLAGVSGAMWMDNELPRNPVNPLELRAAVPARNAADGVEQQRTIESYTVKIGDVCFVAIGQIVGRGYLAVRYQPSGCIVVNSPTDDEAFRARIRAAWTSADPRAMLMDSLLADFATEGDRADTFGPAAAMRLLYYFPNEVDALIAGRLSKLQVGRTSRHGSGSPASTEELDAFIRREAANGIRADEFVAAVAWSRQPRVSEAIQAIFNRSDDIDIVLAALAGIDDRDLIESRLRGFLESLPADEKGAFGDGYEILAALTKRLGASSLPAYHRYLENASALRCYSACQALRKGVGRWRTPILLRLLDDRRPVGGYSYSVGADDRDRRLPIRVCDGAAETLKTMMPEIEFAMKGEYEALDEQIAKLRAAIAAGKR